VAPLPSSPVPADPALLHIDFVRFSPTSCCSFLDFTTRKIRPSFGSFPYTCGPGEIFAAIRQPLFPFKEASPPRETFSCSPHILSFPLRSCAVGEDVMCVENACHFFFFPDLPVNSERGWWGALFFHELFVHCLSSRGGDETFTWFVTPRSHARPPFPSSGRWERFVPFDLFPHKRDFPLIPYILFEFQSAVLEDCSSAWQPGIRLFFCLVHVMCSRRLRIGFLPNREFNSLSLFPFHLGYRF